MCRSKKCIFQFASSPHRSIQGGKVPQKRTGGVKSPLKPNKPAKRLTTTSPRRTIVDARSKILAKNRSKIRDARDKLVQIAKRSGDARNKLTSKRTNVVSHYYETKSPRKMPGIYSKSMRHQMPAFPSIETDSRRRPPMRYAPSRDDRMMDIDEEEYIPSSISLRRTVQNDIAYTKMPPLPSFQRSVPTSADYRSYSGGAQNHPLHPHQMQRTRPRSPPPLPSQSSSAAASMWASDPFDCYEVPVGRPANVSEPKNLHRQIRNVAGNGFDMMMPRKGILRSSRDRQQMSPPPSTGHHIASYGGGGMDESSHLSYEMRARLQRTPDSNQSMGIFSNPYSKSNQPPPSAVMHGYRIVVSNLHSSVSQSDIKVKSIFFKYNTFSKC